MKRSLLLFLLCCGYTAHLLAGGFQLNLQGQKQLGMAHTGVGLLSDASTVLFNPGAVSLLDSSFRISVGMNLLFPRVTYLEPAPGNYSAETVHNIGTPFTFYAATRIKNKPELAFGLGIYTPFGSRQQWEDDWIGQFLIREIDLKTIFIQPTASYRINDHLGVGLGFVYATGSFGLKKGVPAQDSTGAYGSAALSGKAKGMGFNAGIYFKNEKGFSAGIDYRSSVMADISNGDASFSVASALSDYFPTTTFNTGIKLPSVLSLGLGYTKDRYRLALDVNYVGWSSYDSLVIDFAENTDKLADIHSPRLYQNSFIFRLGAEYIPAEKFSARCGVYYDMTPVQDGYLTPETPDVNKIGITGGISYRPSRNFSIDASFIFIEGAERTDINLETGFGGTYKSRALVPGFGIEYIF